MRTSACTVISSTATCCRRSWLFAINWFHWRQTLMYLECDTSVVCVTVYIVEIVWHFCGLWYSLCCRDCVTLLLSVLQFTLWRLCDTSVVCGTVYVVEIVWHFCCLCYSLHRGDCPEDTCTWTSWLLLLWMEPVCTSLGNFFDPV